MTRLFCFSFCSLLITGCAAHHPVPTDSLVNSSTISTAPPASFAPAALIATASSETEANNSIPESTPSATASSDAKSLAPLETYAQHADAQLWGLEMATRNQIDPAWVQAQLAQARFLPQVVRLMTPAPATTTTARDWGDYRRRFINQGRIKAGVRFWNQHAATLARAQAEYGVPASIIVGIIGVETVYGKNMGNLRVLDSLATLAFHFPPAHPRAAERQRYFRGELEYFLRMMHETNTPATQPMGSYAGAMGLGQFMPSSWAKWAVDFDGDGHIDLFHSTADAIGSVANYFLAHGWVAGQAVWYPVQFETKQLQLSALLAPDILPTFTSEQMQLWGAHPQMNAPHAGLLALIELKNGDAAPGYFVGTQNFYAITRYNWSSYYASAVYDLGQEVEAARSQLANPDVIVTTTAPSAAK